MNGCSNPPSAFGTSIRLLHEASEVNRLEPPRTFTRLLHALWMSREDLRTRFDITEAQGQDRFLSWFDDAALSEYGVPPQFATTARTGQFDRFFALKSRALPLIERATAIFPRKIRRKIRKVALRVCNALSVEAHDTPSSGAHASDVSTPLLGANLIGYAQGV